ncbi:zonular occludens toxin domain-containing protein [Cupriavidus sp. YAF13]|uniref:zonular occludens toxin domain-containing protein n=1 Tax=Cupriavidus sp. YAF13 TaxID=3233075 RepID=UPI003F90CEEB
MSDYALTGKKGTGKSSGAVRQMQARLRAGARVATNLNLYMEHLMPAHSRASAIRLPDKPSAHDLFCIGSGNPKISFEPIFDADPKSKTYGLAIGTTDPKILDGYDENENGLLALDEMGTWLNARSFQDPSRAAVLDWFAHGRKFGWDTFYLMQNIAQIDKQVRESFIEYVVRFHRLDKIKIPGVSAATRLITAGQFKGQFPRFHIGVMRLGCDPNGMVADRWVFRGGNIHKAYDTTQVFQESYPHGTFSYLSHWHLEGYKYPEVVPIGWRVLNWMRKFWQPSVGSWSIKDRRLVAEVYAREKSPQKRQKLFEVLARQQAGKNRAVGRVVAAGGSSRPSLPSLKDQIAEVRRSLKRGAS